ncbi:MAG TPA: hypothetical protein VGN82_14125 [Bosea sp. (in: a-proteobacteria)]|jgi:hypothetical protein|uniref:hypothetical protein n=1 Tax=Bosea sp. (in: a-proteobacteria) TaxID=1871050 RepID=UPI002E114847|nr:hypothetical protein [Bosea sp. (in: a-proteobacteria)]
MDPSKLSTENIIGTVLAGLGIAIVGIWKYLSERKAPTAANGDRIIPGVSIADMQPIRELAAEQARTTAANERIAIAAEGLLKLMTSQAQDDAIEEEVERRLRQREADRRRRTTRT